MHLAAHGLPIINDALLTIACDIALVHEAGDHHVVLGQANKKILELQNRRWHSGVMRA